MSILENSVFLTPVLRVNNRQLNIDFYQQNLGLKLVSEENAIAIFTSFGSGNERFVIEESPSVRTRAVEGPKKVNTIVIKTSDAKAIEQLLAHGAAADRLFIGRNGYAFEVLSPEGDRFLLHAEDDIRQLEVTDLPELVAEEGFLGLTDFTFETVILNVLEEQVSRSFYQDIFEGDFPITMDFVEKEGPDLAIEPHITWDLEILEVKVSNDYDLATLKLSLEEKNVSVYLDPKEKILVVSDPSLIEIWFTK